MGMIDNDYLWLHEKPKRSPALRRIAFLLVIPMVAGAAWLTTGTETAHTRTAESDRSDNKTTSPGDLINARAGLRQSSSPDDSGQSATTAQTTPPAQPGQAETGNTPADLLTLAREGRLGQTAITTTVDTSHGAGVQIAAANAESEPATTLRQDESPVSKTHASETDTDDWQEISIEAGDTLSIAFNRHGLSYAESLKLAHMPEYGSRFTRGLKAGDTLRVRGDGDGHVLDLEYPLGKMQTLKVTADGDGFSGEIVPTDVEHRKAYATGTINTSFYVDALDAGLSDRQIMSLVNIFGWDVDFALDIRPGDRFVVVYDELYRDGEKIATGDILAASFINSGDEVRAVRYTNADDKSAYYSPDGREMRKAFIRTPVDYTRISSPFNLSRKHPILNRIRRHEGTDYAAPSGTPIKASGNGRIVFRGRRGGYGNMIIIKHDSHLTTRYGHMSRFNKKFGVGSSVEQGDVIGYVGMSGLATGPHLHYEFRVDGDPKNPETAPPHALPIPKEYRDDFRQHAEPLLAQLDTLTRINIAQAGQDVGKRTN